MKNTLYITLILLLLPLVGYAQKFEGDWKGELDINTSIKLNIILHIKNSNGLWSTTLDSPDQGAMGIPMKNTTVNNDSIQIEEPSLGIKIVGTINDNKLNSKFTQGSFEQLIKFKQLSREDAEKAKDLQRPQTPKAPFPYDVKEVNFSNKSAGVSLAGTLTTPKSINNKKAPAILLIAGSGPLDRDETIMGHKLFAIMADYFTRKGYVVLRYDKRGVNKSEGKMQNITSLDLAEDAEAALEFLRKQNYVDKNNIGLIGHSEGGMIAAMIAKKDKGLNYIVSMAGPGLSGYELLQEQFGYSMPELETYIKDILSYTYNTDRAEINVEDALATTKYEFADANQKMMLEQLAKNMTSPWFIYFIKYNPCNDYKEVKIPVLAINGGKDKQVFATSNIKKLKSCMKNRGILTTKIYDNLNHLFQNCDTGHPNEYSLIEETIDINVLDDISEWIIKKHF